MTQTHDMLAWHKMILRAGMAELADAADLKSAGLKKLVGVRVPLSAPSCIEVDPSTSRLRRSAQDFGSRLLLGFRLAHAC